MSAMDMKDDSMQRRTTGRLFAVLWLLAAAVAMQFVVSAQGFSARFSQQENAGNFSAPKTDTSDTTLSRHGVRAVPVADLRFTADRSDGKAAPHGPGPFHLPSRLLFAVSAHGGQALAFRVGTDRAGAEGHHSQARGPPAMAA